MLPLQLQRLLDPSFEKKSSFLFTSFGITSGLVMYQWWKVVVDPTFRLVFRVFLLLCSYF